MGFIADAAGRQNTLVLSVLGSAITVVAFWLSSAYGDNMGLWVTFVVTYGLFAGGEYKIQASGSLTDGVSRVQFLVSHHCNRGVWGTSIRFSEWLHLLHPRAGSPLGFTSGRCFGGRRHSAEIIHQRDLV